MSPSIKLQHKTNVGANSPSNSQVHVHYYITNVLMSEVM